MFNHQFEPGPEKTADISEEGGEKGNACPQTPNLR